MGAGGRGTFRLGAVGLTAPSAARFRALSARIHVDKETIPISLLVPTQAYNKLRKITKCREDARRRSRRPLKHKNPKNLRISGAAATEPISASRRRCFLPPTSCRKNLEPSDYKHVALGLIFLKHISNAFEAKRAALLAEDPAAAEDPDEYLAENVFWVPKEARWSHLQANARQPTIGKLIDDAMADIEKVNPGLKGVLAKDYSHPALDKVMLGELIDLVSGS